MAKCLKEQSDIEIITEKDYISHPKLCFNRMCGILVLFSIINFGGVLVAICYKKLWKLLIDRDMQKKDLRIAAGLSTNVIAKLGKNQNVSTEVLGKICKILNCEITDIMEFIDEDPEKEKNDACTARRDAGLVNCAS